MLAFSNHAGCTSKQCNVCHPLVLTVTARSTGSAAHAALSAPAPPPVGCHPQHTPLCSSCTCKSAAAGGGRRPGEVLQPRSTAGRPPRRVRPVAVPQAREWLQGTWQRCFARQYGPPNIISLGADQLAEYHNAVGLDSLLHLLLGRAASCCCPQAGSLGAGRGLIAQAASPRLADLLHGCFHPGAAGLRNG